MAFMGAFQVVCEYTRRDETLCRGIVKAMTILSKVIILLFIASIFYALGSALYYLVSDKGDSTRIVKALTWRIGLSVVLFILLFIGFALGWITPHGV